MACKKKCVKYIKVVHPSLVVHSLIRIQLEYQFITKKAVKWYLILRKYCLILLFHLLLSFFSYVHCSYHFPWRQSLLRHIAQYITQCMVKLWMYSWKPHCTIYDKCYCYRVSAHCEMNRLRAFTHCEMNGLRVNVLLRTVDAYHRRLESLSFSLLDTVLIDTGSIFPC